MSSGVATPDRMSGPLLRRLRRTGTRTRSSRWPAALVIALVIFGAAALLALVGKFALPAPSDQSLLDSYLEPGSPGHPLGTDAVGRDILSWIAASIVTAATISVSVVVIASVVGVTVGLVAGYRGGLSETVLMRLVDLQLAIPPLLLFVAAAGILGRSKLVIIVLLSIPSWVPYARVVRTLVLVERVRPSITAARLAGLGHLRIMARHLLPATFSAVTVLASLQLGWILLWETSLSFVGLGVEQSNPSFGFIIAQGRVSLEQTWWVVVFPGIALALLVLASNLLGDGLRDRLDVDVELMER